VSRSEDDKPVRARRRPGSTTDDPKPAAPAKPAESKPAASVKPARRGKRPASARVVVVRGDETFEFSDRLPLLPLRDVVVFPYMTIPLLVGRLP